MVPDSVQPEMPWVAMVQNEGCYVEEIEWDSLSANESPHLKSVWSWFSLIKEMSTSVVWKVIPSRLAKNSRRMCVPAG